MDKVIEILKEHNLKITAPRKEILKILLESDVPLNADQLYKLTRKNKSPNFTSMYRILNQLNEENIIDKSLYQNGVYYYELLQNKKHNHYIICEKCGKMAILNSCPIDEYKTEIEKESGYKLENHFIEFIGICPECLYNEKTVNV